MRILPLSQGFGAEVERFDVDKCRAVEDIASLRDAYAKYDLLIFRNCGDIAPEHQVEVASWFGPVGANSGSDGRPWTVLDNDDAAGREILPFHSDITFMAYPLEGICLHPVSLPDGDTSTTFVSNAVGWAALPPDLQKDMRERTARHSYTDSGNLDFDWPDLEYWHPVCVRHPSTGKPLLFVTEHHVDRISGMGEEESAATLSELFAALYAVERRYEHVWRTGDLLVWNNLAVQHARTQVATPSQGKRVLQRVALGKHNFLEQLEMARRQQQSAHV